MYLPQWIIATAGRWSWARNRLSSWGNSGVRTKSGEREGAYRVRREGLCGEAETACTVLPPILGTRWESTAHPHTPHKASGQNNITYNSFLPIHREGGKNWKEKKN